MPIRIKIYGKEMSCGFNFINHILLNFFKLSNKSYIPWDNVRRTFKNRPITYTTCFNHGS